MYVSIIADRAHIRVLAPNPALTSCMFAHIQLTMIHGQWEVAIFPFTTFKTGLDSLLGVGVGGTRASCLPRLIQDYQTTIGEVIRK